MHEVSYRQHLNGPVDRWRFCFSWNKESNQIEREKQIIWLTYCQMRQVKEHGNCRKYSERKAAVRICSHHCLQKATGFKMNVNYPPKQLRHAMISFSGAAYPIHEYTVIHKHPKFGAFSRNLTTFWSKFRDIFAFLNLTIKLILFSLFYSP